MRIFNINLFNPNFKGQRQDRKTVSQLKEDNKYDLNVPNQRRISEAIDNLVNISGEENIDFLLDVAENLKYGTNIDLDKKSYNDWNLKLRQAAKTSFDKSDKSVQEKLRTRIEQSFSDKKPLTNTEKEILQERKQLLSQVDYETLKNIPQKNIKNIKRNLDYFIISSEVPTSQKLYILKRLNYFMSPAYEINPQLENRKSQALAEMINDIVINTPESEVPNIKAINQKQHGICAAISICRKMLAYEDKPNYIDMILSELDNKNYMEVYDITRLGTNTKVPIQKCDIDFDYSLSKGYRIVDTSAMYWMNVAGTAGATNEIVTSYSSFDKENFDTFNDSHINSDLAPELVDQQDYYRSLLVAKNKLIACKRQMIEHQYFAVQKNKQTKNKVELSSEYHKTLRNTLKKIAPQLPEDENKKLASELLSLAVRNSQKAAEITDYRKDFLYLPNESKDAKLEKIKAFITLAVPENRNTKELKKLAPTILDLTDEIHQTSQKTVPTLSTLSKARMLYSAAAAYRTQALFELDVKERRQNLREEFGMPDDETLVIENMDTLIKKLQKGTLNSEIRERLAHNFGIENTDELLTTALQENKETTQYLLTEILDNLYKSILSVSRKNTLSSEIKGIRKVIDENDDSYQIARYAELFNVKNNKQVILEKLDNYIKTLDSEDCTEKEYFDIYKDMGHSSQLEDFKVMFEELGKLLFEEPNENIIKGFNAMNSGNPDLPIEETLNLYKQVAQNFNNLSAIINSFQQALRVTDNNGNVINTTDAKEIIAKKLENMNEIISAKDLQMLNDRFTKIAKAKSQAEVGSIRDKDLPQELTALTAVEKEVLKKIEKNINTWYSTVSRKLDFEYKDLKEPLDELHRQIGVKTGQKWVSSDGSSGLNSRQEVKIIEHMTDRPYYIEYDGRLALENIKKSPYSGISATSVLDNEYAGHAQYIVDVKPVKIKSGNKYVTKDVIVHDNTWGATEHENTWVDENGLTRTDYQAGYGGSLGYITDENYRNGKIADNILEKNGVFRPNKKINSKIYKKLDGDSDNDGYKFPLFMDIIAPGEYPNSMKYIQEIKDNTLISPSGYIEDLEDYAKNMTKDQIKAVFKKIDTLGSQTNNLYHSYLNRINGDGIIDKGITNLKDYNKLSDDDDLKIILEKLAVTKSYSSIPDLNLFYKVSSMKDVKLMREKVRKEALRNFDYLFANNIDVVRYGAESSRYTIYKLLDDFSSQNNIKLTNADKLHFVNALKRINQEEFDGNLDKTINLMTQSFETITREKTPDFTNKDEKIKDLADSVKSILNKNMKFTLADLNSISFTRGKLERITQWIDQNFNPATDEEFVRIFNNLRNMPKAEFDKKYGSKITNADLGIKEITGYDILKQLRVENEKTMNSFINLIYAQEQSTDIELSKYTPAYDYNKFERVYKGGKYVKNKRSFDDIYSDYYYSLLTLGLEKHYKRNSQQVFENYKMFLAYPKVNPESEEGIQESIESLYKSIEDEIESIITFKAQIKSFEIIKRFRKRIEKLNDNQELTKRQYSLIAKDLETFTKINEDDETIENVLKAIDSTLNNHETNNVSDYKELANLMWKELSPYEKTAFGTSMEDAVKMSLETINDTKKHFIENVIEPRYQQKAYELLNKWVSARAKALQKGADNDEGIRKFNEADRLYSQFIDLYDRHRITKSPEKVLNEYLLMCAKDARPQNSYASGDKAVKAIKDFETLKQVYKSNLEGLLYNANLLEMQYILMDCAKSGSLNAVHSALKKSKLQLKNGTEVPLDSEIALKILLEPMLADSDLDTAVMFIDQLGLSEKVMEMLAKNQSFQPAYKSIKRIHSILASVSSQSEAVEKELIALANIDNDADYKEKILQSKARILKRVKNTNYRKTYEIYEKAYDNAIAQIEHDSENSKLAIIAANLNSAQSASVYISRKNIDSLNEKLRQIQVLYDLICRIHLPENSPAEELRKKYLEEFHKVEEYKNSFSKDYTEIGLEAE